MATRGFRRVSAKTGPPRGKSQLFFTRAKSDQGLKLFESASITSFVFSLIHILVFFHVYIHLFHGLIFLSVQFCILFFKSVLKSKIITFMPLRFNFSKYIFCRHPACLILAPAVIVFELAIFEYS